MSFIKRLFGGSDDRRKVTRRENEVPDEGPVGPDGAPAVPPAASAKELARLVGSGDKAVRRDAVQRLRDMGDRTSMRALMTSYMNYGDPETLDALREYGARLTAPALRDSDDLSIIGARRVRVLDLLAITGDEEALPAVRRSVDSDDVEIRVRARTALVELHDRQGIDMLATDLGVTDAQLRTHALEALRKFDDEPAAAHAIKNHVEHYLAEAGAIPAPISVSAPRLGDRETSLLKHIIEDINAAQQNLILIAGSEAIAMATGRRGEIEEGLAGQNLQIMTRRAPPEEQIATVIAARDRARDEPGSKQIVFGAIPSPRDQVEMPHFLEKGDGGDYSVKIVLVDPHEMGIVMSWWLYIDDMAEVPTEIEVVLAISTPERTAISEEEFTIFNLITEDQRDRFLRAYLAHL
jgi:hypothetical protein